MGCVGAESVMKAQPGAASGPHPSHRWFGVRGFALLGHSELSQVPERANDGSRAFVPGSHPPGFFMVGALHPNVFSSPGHLGTSRNWLAYNRGARRRQLVAGCLFAFLEYSCDVEKYSGRLAHERRPRQQWHEDCLRQYRACPLQVLSGSGRLKPLFDESVQALAGQWPYGRCCHKWECSRY